MWNLETKTKQPNNKKPNLTESRNRLAVSRDKGGGVGGGVEMGTGSQNVPTSSYKVSQSWGYNMQHGDYS